MSSRIKPLLWLDGAECQPLEGYAHDQFWQAEFGEGEIIYNIVRRGERISLSKQFVRYRVMGDFPTVETAKIAAQKDWNRFIASALAP